MPKPRRPIKCPRCAERSASVTAIDSHRSNRSALAPHADDRATPYVRATSLTGRFSTVTAVMTSRAFDIPRASRSAARYSRRHTG